MHGNRPTRVTEEIYSPPTETVLLLPPVSY